MSNVESTNIKEQSKLQSEQQQPMNLQPQQQFPDQDSLQQQPSLQEVNLQQQQFPQTTDVQSVIGGAAIVTTKIQAIPTLIGQLGQQHQVQQQRISVTGTNEPTINLFNSFVAKDTHCFLGRTGVKVW
jgi:hypothetical protein